MKSANPGVSWLSCDIVEIFVLLLPRGLEESGEPAADPAGSDVDGVAVHVVEESVEECEAARL